MLNNRERLDVLEDENGLVSVVGLAKVPVSTAGELTELLEQSSQLRTTQKTDANDASSRSHSVTQIFLHPPGDSEAGQPHIGVLTVVDLAGSERGQDTKSHSRQLRTEGAEINKVVYQPRCCVVVNIGHCEALDPTFLCSKIVAPCPQRMHQGDAES